MTEAQMAKNIQERMKEEYGIELTRDTIKKIMSIEADEIYMVIASEDSYKYSWGTISGTQRKPRKISGKYAELKTVIDNYGYSVWKIGYPKVKWAPQTKLCDIRLPEEYFEQPEVRYTTEARTFREDAGLPEIPEFEGLTEKKIKAICRKADKMNTDKLTGQERSNRKRDQKHNKIKALALHDYWKKVNHLPVGCTSKDWDGEQMDSVLFYLSEKITKDISLIDELEVILTAIDIDEWKYEGKKHPELKELAEKIKKTIEDVGLEPIPHVKKEFDIRESMGLKYNGQDDPWGIKNVSRATQLKQMRLERQQREIQEMINIKDKNDDGSNNKDNNDIDISEKNIV